MLQPVTFSEDWTIQWHSHNLIALFFFYTVTAVPVKVILRVAAVLKSQSVGPTVTGSHQHNSVDFIGITLRLQKHYNKVFTSRASLEK